LDGQTKRRHLVRQGRNPTDCIVENRRATFVGATRFMIRIIFFDAAGTLFHLPRGVGWHYHALALRHGCEVPEEALGRAFGEVWKGMPPRESSRMRREDDDREWWRMLVDRVLDRCSIAVGDLNRSAYFEELYAEFTRPGVWALFPEVKETLQLLAGQYRLGIISNFDGRLRPILKNLGIHGFFDPVIISSEVGAEKPDPWIFQAALRVAAVAPEEAWHVGDDSIRDWEGAAAAGLHILPLDRPTNSLRDLVARLTLQSAS